MKFGVVDGDGQVENGRYETLDKAVEAATKEVTENPDTEVDVVQFIKTVSSELKVDVVDVE